MSKKLNYVKESIPNVNKLINNDGGFLKLFYQLILMVKKGTTMITLFHNAK